MGQLGDGGGWGRAACGEQVWIKACDSCSCCFCVRQTRSLPAFGPNLDLLINQIKKPPGEKQQHPSPFPTCSPAGSPSLSGLLPFHLADGRYLN